MTDNSTDNFNTMSWTVIDHVVTQKASALSAGIAIVRQILKDHQFPDGFTTKRIFTLSQSYLPPRNFKPMRPAQLQQTVPRPDHPIRSITFLKTMILPALEGQQEIQTVVQPRSGVHDSPDVSKIRPIKRERRNALAQEFVWKVIPPEERLVQKVVAERKKVGVEVGVGADISHLNKRRQKGRIKKVTEAVLKLKGRHPFTRELKEITSIPPQ